MSKLLSEFEAVAGGPPASLTWCGGDALLLRWPELLMAVGPFGDYASWPLLAEEHMLVVPEVDCARLLTSSRHDLLRRVSAAAQGLFAPGSTAPAAQLWDAREAYESADPRADRLLRGITEAGHLADAVHGCAEAAGHDLVVARQKALMRAAVYGRAFCPPSFPADLLHGVALRLRVLNALRDASVGVPLTYTQLEVLTLPVVVARLVAARQWLLAFRVAGVIQQLAGPASATPLLAPAGAGGRGAAGGVGVGGGAGAGALSRGTVGAAGSPLGSLSAISAQQQVRVRGHLLLPKYGTVRCVWCLQYCGGLLAMLYICSSSRVYNQVPTNRFATCLLPCPLCPHGCRC